MITKLHGLIAATHTPFDADGQLNLAVIEKQAEHLLRNGVTTAFIGGTTGECHSLTVTERLALAARWVAVTKGSSLSVVVHVGANCLADACTLANQAQQLGAAAISSLAPSYFKPRTLDVLAECCRTIAAAAPALPYYYYDIPVLTGITLSTPDFLALARDLIPTLAGVKFSNSDLMSFQLCLRAEGGRWDVPWGTDEYLLAALALGAKGAVGSSYNFAAPIYHRLIAAFLEGDLASAQEEQFCSVRLIQLLAGYGYMGASKSLMGMLGVPVGPARLPHGNLSAGQSTQLAGDLDQLNFFSWIQGERRQ